MRTGVLCKSLLAASCCQISSAYAQANFVPRDEEVRADKPGTYLHADVFTIGVQATVETRKELWHGLGALKMRSSAMLALPYADVQVFAQLRVWALALGVQAGGRREWEMYAFAPGEAGTRDERSDKKSRGDSVVVTYGYAEARLRMFLPAGEHVLGMLTGAIRYEGRPDRSFDWQNAIMVDGGVQRWAEAVAVLHGERWGFAGPMLRLTDRQYDGRPRTDIFPGLAAGLRLGLSGDTDLLYGTVYISPDDPQFGLHGLGMPVNINIVYRSSYRLGDTF